MTLTSHSQGEARRIVEHHVADEGEQQIFLPVEMRTRIMGRIASGNVDKDLFDEAQIEILNTLEADK
jgi:hypothetical protein